jgi:DNA polymerase/3'-5' exonuclease PolX
MEELLKIMIAKIDPKLILTICGSYRRGKPISGDIDVLITHPDLIDDSAVENSKISYLIEFVDILTQLGFLVDNLTDKGKTKYMGVCRLLFNNDSPIPMPLSNPGRRIDIRFIPYQSYSAGLLYFTGSGQFNKIFRGIALSKGYTVNEYGIYELENGKKGALVPTYSEEEIFDLIGIKYLTPMERDF